MFLKEKIKKSFIGNILYNIRDYIKFPSYKLKKQLLKISISKNKNMILLGTPTYNNLGDHLIALAEKQFLLMHFSEYDIIEIPTQFYISNRCWIKDNLSKYVPICIMGGGWMGDVWVDDEYRMQNMIEDFSDHSITVLPQTVHYSTFDNNRVLDDAVRIYNKCRDIKFCFRDVKSYEFAINHFGVDKNNIYLFPDMALFFYSHISRKIDNVKKINVCLRTDREAVCSNDVLRNIRCYAKQKNIKIQYSSTVVKRGIPIWMREHAIKKILNSFCMADLVVTDRLHAMIMALICGRKCIAFDNLTHKVSGVYELWLKNSNSVYLVKEHEICNINFEMIINDILKVSDDCIEKNIQKNIHKEFEKMANIIRRNDSE